MVPIFWEDIDYFLSSWFLEFDPISMSITHTLVRFIFPITFLAYLSYGEYREFFGPLNKNRFRESYRWITDICLTLVEIYPSNRQPNEMILNWKYFQWTHILDYENITFHCQIFHLQGHLQNYYPHA